MALKRLYHISFLQVLGPILVIFGHSLNGIFGRALSIGGLPQHWVLSPAKLYVYVFHMPLFFFISGYLLTYMTSLEKRSYTEFIKAKSLRLLFPYVALNLLFIVPKYFMVPYIADQVSLSVSYVVKALVFPRETILGHLWFLFALFMMFVISPFFYDAIRSKNWSKRIFITAISMVLYFYPVETDFFGFKDISENLFAFWGGMLLGAYPVNLVEKIFKEERLYSILVGLVIVFSVAWFQDMSNNYLKLSVCILMLLALLGMSFYVKINSVIFEKIAGFSFGIYIMHWPVMIFLRTVALNMLKFDNLTTVFVMLVGGFFIPVFILNTIKVFRAKLYKEGEGKWLYYLIGV